MAEHAALGYYGLHGRSFSLDDASLILFLTASLVVIVAPGPDNILVLTRGVTLGRMAALVSAAGASVGLVCHSLFAAAGLSALLAQSAAA